MLYRELSLAIDMEQEKGHKVKSIVINEEDCATLKEYLAYRQSDNFNRLFGIPVYISKYAKPGGHPLPFDPSDFGGFSYSELRASKDIDE